MKRRQCGWVRWNYLCWLFVWQPDSLKGNFLVKINLNKKLPSRPGFQGNQKINFLRLGEIAGVALCNWNDSIFPENENLAKTQESAIRNPWEEDQFSGIACCEQDLTNISGATSPHPPTNKVRGNHWRLVRIRELFREPWQNLAASFELEKEIFLCGHFGDDAQPRSGEKWPVSLQEDF